MPLIGDDYTTGDGLSLGVSLVLLEIPDEAWIRQVLISAFNTLTIEENWTDAYGDITTDQATRIMSLMLQTLQFDYEPPPMIPIGGIQAFGGSSAPSGWLLCDGSVISRTTYADLFSIIGTSYGAGNGTTTFGLPDMRGRSPYGMGDSSVPSLGATAGATAVALTINNMPSHDHDYSDPGHRHTQRIGTAAGSNALAVGTTNNGNFTVTRDNLNDSVTGITFHAQGSNIPHNNLHPVIGVNFIIFAGV